MKMELSAKTAKAFVKAVENLTEMCLIVFDEEGVRTRIVNGEQAIHTIWEVRFIP